MGNEKGVFEANQKFGAKTKRAVAGMLISQVGDLLNSGTDAFTSYISGRLENEYCVELFEGYESLYLGTKIKKAPNEHIAHEDISDGA